MPQQVMIDMEDEVQERLVQIPTATTLGERQLALYYLSRMWDGTGDVFENGPLLGGATRALALGMTFNEKKKPGSYLRTYDWFSLDQPLDLPAGVWRQLITRGMLTADQVEQAHEEKSFLPLFVALHENEDYWGIVDPHVGYLPGHRGEVPPEGEAAIFRAPDREFAVAFVDGCKSWHGTKHWFREILPHLRLGADLMFQDFGHYTCFWISSLIGEYADCFKLIGYTDHTYVWRLTKRPHVERLDDRFPDEPTGFDRETFDRIYDWHLNGAAERSDRYAVMIHQAHRAAAYAYIGLEDEAREILDQLLMVAEWFPFRDYLRQARVSPTYTPEARIEL